MIERIRGQARGRNRASAYKDLVWTVATAGDTSADIAGQTRQALATIEQALATPWNTADLHATAAAIYRAASLRERADAELAKAREIDPHAAE